MKKGNFFTILLSILFLIALASLLNPSQSSNNSQKSNDQYSSSNNSGSYNYVKDDIEYVIQPNSNGKAIKEIHYMGNYENGIGL